METIARGIHYADLDFLGWRRVIAAAVLDTPDGVALLDPGPTSCLETLRAALAEHGLGIGDVRTVLLTHIHLDHAGATGTLLKENPDIAVYVHEVGAPHMVDPEKLLSSAARLYGDDMDRLWGEFLPVPERSIHRLSGGERLEVGDRELEVVYLPGHASHHVGFFDSDSGVAFVGDTAGVRVGTKLFAMPPTPPPDIDIEKWTDSLEQIRRRRASTLVVTHFGPHEDVDAQLDAMLEHLDGMKELARKCLALEGDDDRRMRAFAEEMLRYLQRHVPPDEVALYEQAAPLTMCWLGLARYWKKRGVTVGAG